MNTIVTEFHSTPCSRCGGARFIAQFQHRKGGECFRCGATGLDPNMRAVEREMTDAEVLAALGERGFPVIFAERPETGDYLVDLFLSPAQVAEHTETMKGARMFLAALPGS